jgi:hypothetical protein
MADLLEKHEFDTAHHNTPQFSSTYPGRDVRLYINLSLCDVEFYSQIHITT